MGVENVRAQDTATTTELTLDQYPDVPATRKRSRLDTPKMHRLHRQLLDRYYQEREKQAINRYEMAIDHAFYDGDQWDEESAQEVESRGQKAIVYNEVAPMCDWMIGTERRTKVDWNVLPRAEDDVEAAETKKKVLKYLADVNMTVFKRSRAFADAIKGGVGWVDDGVCNDPTQEPIYSAYEDWRYVLWDSSATDLALKDGRYLFRWRWTDLDIAEAFFPDRKAELRRTAVGTTLMDEEDEDFWYLGQHYQARDQAGSVIGRRAYLSDAGVVGNRRKRVKLIEAWYRMPVPCQMCYGDEFDGEEYDPKRPEMVAAKESGAIGLYQRVQMRMFVAIMTEHAILEHSRSPYKHDQFPLTPIWCYRRNRDRMPYGMIRRVRDIQEDLNKRASKAQFVLSTNQIVAERGAVEDWEEAREEADRPDGVIVVAPNRKFELKRDSEMAKGHVELMTLDAMKIQTTGGVNNENLGRETNAESGKAIEARQLQGSVVTTEPFDNLRLAIQVQGQKQLSLAEQFMSAPKVIRLTGDRNKIDWVKINQPEVQPDGSVRWLNDMTAAAADFIVSEQDFHGSMRQAMFEYMMSLVGRAGIVPELALKLLRMAFEFSDFPNKDAIVSDLRAMIGEPDPTKKPSPEEAAAQAAMQAQQQAVMQQQQEAGKLALEEQRANVALINAKARQIIRDMDAGGDQNAAGSEQARAYEDAIREVQRQADEKIAAMSQQLVKVQAESANRFNEIATKAESEKEIARIKAEGEVRVAAIEKETAAALEALMSRFDELADQIEELRDEREEEDEPAEKPEKAEKAEPAAPAAPSVVIEKGAIQIGLPAGEDDEEEEPKPKPKRRKKVSMKITGPGGETYSGEMPAGDDDAPRVRVLKIKGPSGKVYTGTIEEK